MPAPSSLRSLSILHVLNDGFYASFLLFLPFLSAEFSLNLTQAGLLGTVVNALGLLCTLPAGYLAVRMGGMKLLMVAAVLYGLGYVSMGFIPSYAWLFPAFAVAGIGFAVFHPVAFALVARLSLPRLRGRTMANFTATGDIGKMGISTVFTFIVASVGWRSTAFLYGAVALGVGCIFLLSLLRRREHVTKIAPPAAPVRLRDIITRPSFILALLASFLDVFASTPLFIFLPFLLLTRGIDAAFLGTFTAVYFLGNLFGKSVLGRFSDRYGNASVFIVSEMLMAVCIILLASSSSLLIIILTSIIAGAFTKGTVPVIQTMIAEASDHHGHFERSFAVAGFTNAIALTLAPVVFGVISDAWGIVGAFYAMAGIAAFAVIPALFFRSVDQKI